MVLGKLQAKNQVEKCISGEMTQNETVELIINLYESFMEASIDAALLEHQLDLAEGHILNQKSFS